MVADLDGPRCGAARQRSEARLSDGLVYGKQGIERRRVGVAGERHLTEDVRQLAEEDAGAGVSTFHLIDEDRLVILHSTSSQHQTNRCTNISYTHLTLLLIDSS